MKVGMSAAGRKMSAMGRFLTRAMSSRFSRRNWMSAPSSRLSVACCSRPSGAWACYVSGMSAGGGFRGRSAGAGNILLGTAKSSRPSRLREHAHVSCCHGLSSHASSVGSSSLGRGTRAYWLTKSMAKDVPAPVSSRIGRCGCLGDRLQLPVVSCELWQQRTGWVGDESSSGIASTSQ